MSTVSTAKTILSVAYGFLFGILAIGILPFLLIYAFVDINGLSDVYPPPFFLLPGFLRDAGDNRPSDRK
jgi:hypothetical protein